MRLFVFLFALSCLGGPLCTKGSPGNITDKAQNINSPGNAGNPPGETPSGTQPANPANPGENPATPAEPGDKEKPDKDQKDKHGKDGKSGSGGPSLPAAVPTPQGVGAAAGAIGGGIIGGILSGGKKDADKKKEKPKPALKKSDVVAELALPKEAAASSDTVKSTASVQASTPAAAAEPLYSKGKGPKIAIMDFDGEYGAQFAELLAEALKSDLKVYNRKELAKKNYDAKAVNRVSTKKIATEVAVDYIVTGKVSKKTETLSIISVFLRDGKTGDIKMTTFPKLKSADDLKSAAETAARKIKKAIK